MYRDDRLQATLQSLTIFGKEAAGSVSPHGGRVEMGQLVADGFAQPGPIFSGQAPLPEPPPIILLKPSL